MRERRAIHIILSLFLFNLLFSPQSLLAKEGVSIAACIRTQYRYTKSQDKIRHAFTIRNAILDFRKDINEHVSARIDIEVGDLRGEIRRLARDLYCAIKKKPFEVRIGQFKQALGIEVVTPTPQLDFIDPSLIERHRAPKDVRDIGVMLIWRHDIADARLAVVNGTGRNVLADDNKWKDLSGRLVFRKEAFMFGGNFYYGKIGPDDALKKYHRWGLEMEIKTPIELAGEFLFLDDTLKGKGLYTSLVYRHPHWQPLFRYDWFEYGKTEKKLYTFGVNFLPLKEVKLGFNYAIEDKKNWRILSQFQIAY